MTKGNIGKQPEVATGGLVPPPLAPVRGPQTDWGELVQVHDDRDIFQASPQELPATDIHGL